MSRKATRTSSSSSTHARALRSARALEDALLTLLETTSFDQIMVKDICAAAGVHYATFFRHHATKESLLDAVAEREIRQLSQRTVTIRDAADYLAGCRALCAYVDEHRQLWATLLNGGAGAAMREAWMHQSRIVAEGDSEAGGWLPVTLGVTYAATLIAETLAWWLAQPREAYSVEEVAHLLHRVVTFLINPPPA